MPADPIAANTAFWDTAAARWRTLDLPDPAHVRDVVERLAAPPGSRLLDAGCGPGRWTIALAEAGFRAHGVDLAPAMVRAAATNAHDRGLSPGAASFTVARLDALPFPAAAFDAIICYHVLDFVPAPGAALVELARVLRPAGRLVLATLGAHSPVKRESWRRFLPGNTVPAIANEILPWETAALLGELGWQIAAERPCFGPAVSGAANEYDEARAAALADHILQQAIASSWEFVAVKPATGSPASG